MVFTEITQASFVPIAPGPRESKWARERQAFYRMLGTLLNEYPGKFVAIHNEEVVASGDDIVEVALKAYSLVGRQEIFVDQAVEHPLAPLRFPHYRELKPSS